jgi:hypothetical protein
MAESIALSAPSEAAGEGSLEAAWLSEGRAFAFRVATSADFFTESAGEEGS